MKNNFQSNDVMVTLGGASIQHPISIHSASIGTRWQARVWKYAACLLLAFVLGIGNVWGAITPKTISDSDGEVYMVTPANLYSYYNSGNGWVTNASGGEISSASYYSSKNGSNNTQYIIPETEATATSNTQASGITLKTADNRSARFYFTGAVKATAFIAATGSSRTATITVYKVSDNSEVGSTTGTNYSASGPYEKLEVTGLSASVSYYAKVTATNDLCLYAMKFFAASSGGGGSSTYSITYHCNGGATCPSDLTEQTALPDPLATLTKTNYTWGGWYTDATFSSAASAGASLSANADLYAKFTQSITLDSEGGSDGSSSVTATYNSATLGSITNPTKDGYSFAGWYDGDDGTGNLVINTSGVLQANVSGYTGAGGIWTSSTARTLHAKWVEDDGCDLIFWFNSSTDATNAGVTSNPDGFFGSLPSSSGNSAEGSITIDGETYSVTARTSNATPTISFTVPTNKTGKLYAIVVGSSSRSVILKQGSTTIQTIAWENSCASHDFDAVNAGTYTITSSGNMGWCMLAVKICDAASCSAPKSLTNGTTTYNSQAVTWTKGDDESAWEVIHLAKDATAPAANATPDATVTSASYTFTGLTASTAYDWYVRAKCGDSDKSDWVKGTSFTTEDIPACAAGVPGNISKGTLSSGTLTLNAAGEAVSGDTWYWQTVEDGEAKTNSGSSFDVTAAGTYYIRSYNTAGDCWSNAKSFVVEASDLLTTPTATFSNGAYTVGASALGLSTLWSSNSDGAVTYALKVASDDASVSDGAFSATKAGSYVVTATQAATASYSGIIKEATITVTYPATGAATITYNVATGTSQTTLATASKGVNSSSISNLSDIALAGEGMEVQSGGGKDNSTPKIPTPASETASKYTYLTFDVASGYEFTISAISTKLVAVSTGKTVKLEISDNNGGTTQSLSYSHSQDSDPGTAHTFEFATNNTYSGTVTIKLFVYEGTESTGTYRLGKPLTITGTVATAVTKYNLTFAKGDEGASGEMATLKYAEGAEVTLPACTFTAPTSKEFDEWVVTKTVGGAEITVTNNKFTMPAEAVTATATWVTATPGYYVTYNGSGNDGGDVPVDAYKHESGATVTVLGNTGSLTKTIGGESAAFHGWNTNSDMSSGSHYEAEETFDMPDAAVTLYAVWGFALNYDADDGTINDASYATWYISTGAESSINTPLPSDVTKDGYVFDGWYTQNGVGSKVTAINAEYTGNFEGDWKLKAKWTEAPKTVSFNMNGHGATITAQDVMSGGTATAPFVADVDGWVFGGWYTDAECTAGNEFSFATTITADRTLYAKWTADTCSSERKSLSKVVLTAADDGTVSGYNDGEYAGSAVIAGLDGTQTAEVDGSHEGVETGYKMNGKGSAILFATLKKGTFQEGDKVVFTITKKNDVRAVDADKNILTIYYGTNASDATELTTIKGVSAAGTYTYRLTAADVTAIGSKKGIGLFRVSGDNGQNPYVYSVEITGCRNWTVMRTVSFDMKDHGSAIADVPVEDGEKISAPAEPEAEGYLFKGWFKETTLENEWDFANDVVEADITLYAKWATDPCSDRQSLSKVVLTAKDNGTVTGYNSKEYAGDAIISGLDGSEDADIIGDATKERGYKLNNGGSAILFATLAKGNFQEGDKVTVGITKINDTRTVDASTAIMTIYAGSDKDHTMEVTTLTGVSAPGFYTYRLTAADATAINTAGYKSIGLFRASSNGQNHYVYSVEITGCRDWSASHDVTFNMHDHGSAIAAQSVYEGGKVTKPAVVEPEGWAFDGWYKESTYENEWDFDVDVMGTSDIELHAKWESEAGAIKLFDGEGNLNTTNFISPAKTTIEISSVTYPTLVDFGSNRTSLSQAKQADMVMYSATTDATKIKFELYNNATSAKTAYLWLVEEGDAAATAVASVEVAGKTRVATSYYTFNGTKNRSFYLTSGSKSDIKVMQVKVMETGTAIPQFGKAGYSVDFNKGRIAVASNGTVSFEGASIHSNDEYSVLNNESLKPKTYIQFNNAVANTTVKIKKASSNAYYVTNDLDNKGTSYTTDQEIVMSTTGTWYIGSVNSGSVAALSKIEFIAPKCEAPTFEALANSDICSGDAYVALDGTGSVSDGGSITYKWYAEGDAETVLATTATYTPIADGSYYVVALHHVDGYTDNEATSDVVTVTTHEGTAITEGLAHVRKTAGEAATLTVEATGKDLHYAWKECETIDGTYTDVAGAADSKSLEIIVPDGIKYYKVIVSSGCGADQESIAKVEKFVPVAQVVVSTSVSWDLTICADAEIKLTSSTSPKKGEECLMANIEGVHMDENFHSESLVMSGEYIYRDVTGRPTCAEYMKFETSVPGLVRVHFAGNGSNRCLRITSSDGVQYSSVSTGTSNDLTEQFEVAAGEIELMGMNDGHTDDKKYMRFFQIEFYSLDMERNDSWIAPHELGTVCYPNGHIVVGADMYQMAGVDENNKFAFDQVTVTEPGVPYLFEATGYDPIKFYKTTAAAAAEAGTSNGMVGTFVDKTLTPAEGENLYYFQGTHFYSVADRTKNLSVPANRCYVDLNDPHPAMAPKAGVRRISFGVNGMNVTTGIENDGLINGENGVQKVLINGQLFILRGEKMYDATGRLIK